MIPRKSSLCSFVSYIIPHMHGDWCIVYSVHTASLLYTQVILLMYTHKLTCVHTT